MTDKKLTDKEVVKALECCLKREKGSCNDAECPLFYKTVTYTECRKMLLKATLDLINRLQAENERLKRELNLVCENSISAKLPHCVLCGNNVAVLTKDLKGYDEFIADISAEAYKQCIEKVKEYYKNKLQNYQFNYDDYCKLCEELNNLLKELVGDK